MLAKCKFCQKEFGAKRKTAQFCCDLHRTLFNQGKIYEEPKNEKSFEKEIESIFKKYNASPENKKYLMDFLAGMCIVVPQGRENSPTIEYIEPSKPKSNNTGNVPLPDKKPEPIKMTLQQIKDMCPKELTGVHRGAWIGEKRKELGI